jgi:hypothetical protein
MLAWATRFPLLENNVLHALDALHVACALEWQADRFVTSDRRQFTAAMNTGLRAEYIGQPISLADGVKIAVYRKGHAKLF